MCDIQPLLLSLQDYRSQSIRILFWLWTFALYFCISWSVAGGSLSKSTPESAYSPYKSGLFPTVWEEVLIQMLDSNKSWLAELFRNLALPWLQSFLLCVQLCSLNPPSKLYVLHIKGREYSYFINVITATVSTATAMKCKPLLIFFSSLIFGIGGPIVGDY